MSGAKIRAEGKAATAATTGKNDDETSDHPLLQISQSGLTALLQPILIPKKMEDSDLI